MKKTKVAVPLIIVIILGSFWIHGKSVKNPNYTLNSLALANLEALTQGESGGWGGNIDSVEFVTDTRSVRYMENWSCSFYAKKDTRRYTINVTRSCDGKGLIPCAGATWTESTGTEERSCEHQRHV